MADSDSKIMGEGQLSDILEAATFVLPTGPLSPSIVFGDFSPTYNLSCVSGTSSALISPPQSTVGTDYNDNDQDIDQDNDYDADTDDNGSIMPPATKRQQHEGSSGNVSSNNSNNHKNQIRLPINVFLYGTLADPYHIWLQVDALGRRWRHHDDHHLPRRAPDRHPRNHDTDVVHGKVWVCHTMERFRLLQRYKTSMYSHTPCSIEVHNGPAVGRIVPGRTFCWPASRGLEGLEPVKGTTGGRWDLSEYHRSDTYRMIREATIWVDTAETEVKHRERGRQHPPRLPLYSS
ncbi:hypothetical protein MCOR02_007915 [Pyricularia oryzae]|nr:hypothetical protein MCOR02_007915 [Pyricularia oryzae]